MNSSCRRLHGNDYNKTCGGDKTPTHHSSIASVRSFWVASAAFAVKASGEPICAPFPYISGNIVESISVFGKKKPPFTKHRHKKLFWLFVCLYFQPMFGLIFENNNWFRTLESKRAKDVSAKNTVYRFLNQSRSTGAVSCFTCCFHCLKTVETEPP